MNFLSLINTFSKNNEEQTDIMMKLKIEKQISALLLKRVIS
jgi:hypothetical protein